MMTRRFRFFLVALPLLLTLAVPGLAGATYTQAAGTPPVCTSLAFRPWVHSLLAYRRAECPIARATTYYFAQAGSDTTGDGSSANPWKTITKADATLQASSGGIALLLKRGDAWRGETRAYTWTLSATPATGQATAGITPIPPTTPMVGDSVTLTGGTSETLTVASYAINTATNVLTLTFSANVANAGHTGATWTGLSCLNVTKPNCTVGAWGTGTRPPVISAFQGLYKKTTVSNNVTRGDTFARAWSSPETGTVVYLREQYDVLKVWRRVSSIQQVDWVPGSFWQDTAAHVVYFHDFDDAPVGILGTSNGNGRNYESVLPNNATAVYVQDVQGTRIDGIRVDGYGAKLALDANGARSYGIKGTLNGTNTCVISRCESYFNDNHAIGILGGAVNGVTGSGTGGHVVYDRCRAGWDTTADTDYVAYNTYGGNETVAFECLFPGQFVPVGIQPTLGGSGFLTHSGSVVPAAYATGQPSLTLAGDVNNWPYAPFRAGDSVTLTGGTSETLTVASYVPATGVLTFTANIANAGHTGFTFAAGNNVGSQAIWSCRLCLEWGCRNEPGPYQSATSFGSSAAAPPWTDLAGCRGWVVGEQYLMRPRTSVDANTVTLPLTAASQAATTVTTSITYPGTYTTPVIGSWATLTGGTSGPETVQITAINTGTGVITFGSTIVGASRTALTLDLGLYNGAAVLGQFRSGVNTAYLNGQYGGGMAWGGAGGSSSGVNGANTISPGSVVFNSTFSYDWSGISDPVNGLQNRAIFNSTASTTYGSFYNCRFAFRTAARDQAGIDLNALAGTRASGISLFNCLVTGETPEGGAAPGIGNTSTSMINDAFAGITIKTGTPGYDQDPFYVELTGVPPLGHPSPDSPLLTAHNQAVLGYRLEYDADWLPRSILTPAIGPYEPVQVPYVSPRRTLN